MVRQKNGGRGETRGSAKDAKPAPQMDRVEPESSGAKHSSKRRQGADLKSESFITVPVHTPSPGLYIVGTPIGNLSDISVRAVSVLAGVDVIACEDTRITKRLTGRYGISTRLLTYHDHNAKTVRPKILARIERGEAVALVSDAGMPLVSDPGYKLVQEAVARGIMVTVVPGASSVSAALVVSGLPTDRYLFAGFLPSRKAARVKALRGLEATEATLIFFEAARRLPHSLADMRAVLGDRPASVARELTKKFEQVARGTLGQLASRYASDGAPKGEVVVVVGPPEQSSAMSTVDLDSLLEKLLARHSLKEAVAVAAADTGLPRREVYARALQLTKPS